MRTRRRAAKERILSKLGCLPTKSTKSEQRSVNEEHSSGALADLSYDLSHRLLKRPVSNGFQAWVLFPIPPSDAALPALRDEQGKLPKAHVASRPDPRDAASPDHWIPRNTELVRLTGKHPFNAEPPIERLYDEGFITPTSLHFVRNHGRTPRLEWENHTLTIKGFVKKPKTFTMEELARLPKTTLPVTLVCSANRRKELNMIKQSTGFNWGPAATSTNVWTGVKLLDLLVMCDVDMSKAKHVHLLGISKEKLPKGVYGTSIDISTAMDPFGDVIVAWEQNGNRIAPDHGFPLRIIIPGWISGRMVKWLDTIEVNDEPSDLYYHFRDNILFPSYVDAERADSEDWWSKRAYHMNQLHINSVIVKPGNGERIVARSGGSFTVKGYAFSGNGRKITRVEISLDDGKSWRLCTLDYPEERFSHAPYYGRYYCWMFWECDVQLEDLASRNDSREIRCRAWDQANNRQPRDLSWNLVGTGNNAQFVIKVNPKIVKGTSMYEFEHPIVSGTSKGGWMMTQKLQEPVESKQKEIAPASIIETYEFEEVQKHNTEGSAWIVVDDKVYDCTSYLSDHPGGASSILMSAGEDASQDFHAIHSDEATKMLDKFYIGTLTEDDESIETDLEEPKTLDMSSRVLAANSEAVLPNAPAALDSKQWTDFELMERTEVSDCVRMLKFKLPTPNHRLGVPVGYYMFVKAVMDGKPVIRAFTPVSYEADLGSFTLCVKVYFPDDEKGFPNGGKMSQYMDRMQAGDILSAKGPLGRFEYRGRGKYLINGVEGYTRKLAFICGGTGLAPVYQIMQAVARDDGDKTEVHLLYSCSNAEEILMRKELDEFAISQNNLHVWNTLSQKAPCAWDYGSGRINEEMIRARIPSAREGCVVGVCGPPAMVKEACLPGLLKLGYKGENIIYF